MTNETRARLEAKYNKKNEKYIKEMDIPGRKKHQGGGRPGGPGGMPGGGKPKNAKASIVRLLSYLKDDKWKLIFVFFIMLLSSVSSIVGTYILRPVINNMGDATLSVAEKMEQLATGILFMAVIYSISVACQYLQSRIMIGVSQHALANIRKELFAKVSKLPLRYYDSNNAGDIMSRFTNDVDALGNMLNNSIVSMFTGAITLIGTVALMFYTNVWLTIITLITTPLFVFAAQSIVKKSRKYYKQQQAALGILNGYVEETVSGQKVVKVFNHEAEANDEFEYLNEDLRSKQLKAQFFGGIMGPVMGNLSQVSYSITAMIGGILCVVGGFDIGGLTIFVNYSRQFSRPINELSMQVNEIFSALAGAERVFEVMDTAPETPDVEGAVTPDPIKGEVVLDHVVFGYNEDKIILNDVSLYAKPGQKIALVGSTGAGKTTITNLITRFYDINSGSITIDGIDIRDYKRDYLRKNIAMVLQDTHLFSGTVRDNIRYGRLDATDEEVIEAAKLASAHSFIMRLENGYDTVLEGDGVNLSQGQRQLLNIARAAISKAPILILDEATSSVDTRTERHIEHGMDRLMANRTTIVIAHRLSTVRNANAIIVLENGQIVERGDHDELLKLQGRYYELYTGKKELD